MRRTSTFSHPLIVAVLAAAGFGCTTDADPTAPTDARAPDSRRGVSSTDLDRELRQYLAQHGFTGRIASTLEARLGRRVDPKLADLGRVLWFDPITGLNDDNSCGGCHSPTNGFAIRSRLQSESTTMASSARTAAGPATSDAPPSS